MKAKYLITTAALAVTAITLSACAPETTEAQSSSTNTADVVSIETIIEDVDIDTLLEAAKDEPALTVYDGTSKIEKIAENFAEHYGLEVTGSKADASEVTEIMIREAAADNVQGDVFALSDLAAVNNELLANGSATAWLPTSIAENMPESAINPPVVINDPSMFAYNSAVHDVCPAENIWEFTDTDSGLRLAMQDPLNDSGTLNWFSQMSQFASEELEYTYADYFGEEFSGDDITEEFVAKLAANEPLLTKSSEEASEAVGAPGQTEPPMGLMSSAKFRNNDELGYNLAACDTIEPFVGYAKPKAIVMASGTDSPNAAKLFIHWMYTQEGIEPQIADGKISTNSEIVQPEDPANVGELSDRIFTFDGAGVDTDWANRENWSDLWRMNS
ncbi:ABC transporter substrate-binding protein [uncultured Corynebacterium sp.]|uniref:ABC transporter substrate-binding protein n=1 Tax=uncultured Corynebacterium sp. TaxID=159447 RepID=UPI0025E4E37F|nr:ABC transporter substrate-binding protein [uncultured Corynebacterium sp.]